MYQFGKNRQISQYFAYFYKNCAKSNSAKFGKYFFHRVCDSHSRLAVRKVENLMNKFMPCTVNMSSVCSKKKKKWLVNAQAKLQSINSNLGVSYKTHLFIFYAQSNSFEKYIQRRLDLSNFENSNFPQPLVLHWIEGGENEIHISKLRFRK